MPNQFETWLTRVGRSLVDRLMTHDACCLLGYSNEVEGRYVYSLLGAELVWINAVEISASSPPQAAHVMGVLVREMRQTGIPRWLGQHRAFTIEGRVCLRAGDVIQVSVDRADERAFERSYARDSVDDNFGGW
jgi:hypothetical protein